MMRGVTNDETYARRVLITAILGVLAFSSSMTIVSAVLATIAEDFGAEPATIGWAVSGLFLTMAIGTPVLGRVGDAVGRKELFVVGTAILTVGTLACAFAWNAGSFIAFRMLVGVGIAATMPNGMALLIDAYPPEKRAVAVGWFQTFFTGVPVVALVIGSFLTELFGWRSVFLLLTPFAVAAFTMSVRWIRRTGPSRPDARVDWWGALLLGGTILPFLLALEQFRRSSITNPTVLGLATAAVVGLVAFVVVERRVAQPLLRLGYFTRRNFSGPMIGQSFSQFAYMGGFQLTPLMLQKEFGLGVAASSWILLFRPGVFSAASPFGGRLASRVGGGVMISAGGVLMVVSMALFAVAASADLLWLVVVGLSISGLAMGLASPSFSTTLATAVDPADLGVANGMASTMMNIGMLSGVQTMFAVLGDGRAGDDFARSFWVGGAVATVAVVGGLLVTRDRTPSARSVASSG